MLGLGRRWTGAWRGRCDRHVRPLARHGIGRRLTLGLGLDHRIWHELHHQKTGIPPATTTVAPVVYDDSSEANIT